MNVMLCRFCKTPLHVTFCDLGTSPLANALVPLHKVHQMEPFYPLHVYVCDRCWLVQLMAFESPEHIFEDYVYFSSYSSSWLEHTCQYAQAMVRRFGINTTSKVVEIASNDGYLLKNFRDMNIPVLGVEPARNIAKVAIDAGIPTLVDFFSVTTASALKDQGHSADLLLGNNVLAHVPDLNDFVEGMRILLKPNGIITIEFPHLLRLMEGVQFDTIYHEHFSYFSFTTVEAVFAAHGIRLFDVEEWSTHGGSLRIYGCHRHSTKYANTANVVRMKAMETEKKLDLADTYRQFQEQVRKTKHALLRFLIEARWAGKSIVGYGAAAKGNTLLNYCGIRGDFLDYVVDASPHKQNCFLPGTRIPVHAPDRITATRPDYILILPWNIKDEIMKQMEFVRTWGGQFVIPTPTVQIIP